MPRLPVDGKKVVEHRITLGQFERNMLDTYFTSQAFKNVATPTVALLSDVSGMITFAGLLLYVGIKVDLTDLGSSPNMAQVVKRIEDAVTLSRDVGREEGITGIPYGFIQSFLDQLKNQDFRFDLDPRGGQ